MYVNHGGARYGNSNCAMCTLAAINDTTSDMIATVLRARGQSDDDLAAAFDAGALTGGDQLRAVISGMINLVTQLRQHVHQPIIGTSYGSYGNYKTAVEIRTFMLLKPAGTVFAVWAYQTEEIEGLGAHWNFAHVVQGQAAAPVVEFCDYQDDDHEGAGPARDGHFLAPRPDRDDSPMYQSFILLSFEPAPVLSVDVLDAEKTGGVPTGDA